MFCETALWRVYSQNGGFFTHTSHFLGLRLVIIKRGNDVIVDYRQSCQYTNRVFGEVFLISGAKKGYRVEAKEELLDSMDFSLPE